MRSREKADAYAKKYRLEKLDPVVLAAYYRQWRVDNRDKIRETRASPEYREKANKRRRERYASDPVFRAKNEGRRSRWVFTEHFTYAMLLELRSQDCFYCGNEGGSVDHLVPRCKGGPDQLDNLVPCCRGCNARKGISDLTDFYKKEP